MTKKLHDALRFLQWFVPALTTFYGVIDKVFNWGYAPIVMTISAGFVAFIGVCVEHDSSQYFDTRMIVNKVYPDMSDAAKEETL